MKKDMTIRSINWFDDFTDQEQYMLCHKYGVDYIPRPTDREIFNLFYTDVITKWWFVELNSSERIRLGKHHFPSEVNGVLIGDINCLFNERLIYMYQMEKCMDLDGYFSVVNNTSDEIKAKVASHFDALDKENDAKQKQLFKPVFVDHLSLIKSDTGKSPKEIKEMMDKFKDFAKEHKYKVVLPSTANKLEGEMADEEWIDIDGKLPYPDFKQGWEVEFLDGTRGVVTQYYNPFIFIKGDLRHINKTKISKYCVVNNYSEVCRKCNGNAINSKAIVSWHNWQFPHDGSKAEFETHLVDCLKCEKCGHSWTEGSEDQLPNKLDVIKDGIDSIKSLDEEVKELEEELWNSPTGVPCFDENTNDKSISESLDNFWNKWKSRLDTIKENRETEWEFLPDAEVSLQDEMISNMAQMLSDINKIKSQKKTDANISSLESFKISFDGATYKVDVPNYNGGHVIPLEVYNQKLTLMRNGLIEDFKDSIEDVYIHYKLGDMQDTPACWELKKKTIERLLQRQNIK